MNGIFSWIYGWFISIFGEDLDYHLFGYECQGEEFVLGSRCLYTPIGIVALGVAILFFVLYYYVVNSAKLNRWWHWVIVLLLVGIVNFFVGYAWTNAELPNVSECLTVKVGDCWLFGLANAIVSSLFFIIISFAGKWGSSQCKWTPF